MNISAACDIGLFLSCYVLDVSLEHTLENLALGAFEIGSHFIAVGATIAFGICRRVSTRSIQGSRFTFILFDVATCLLQSVTSIQIWNAVCLGSVSSRINP